VTVAPSVRHLGCPACGATLVRREDQRVVRCRACGNRCVLAGVEVARRFQVVPKVARERAVAVVRGALAKWPVREGAADEAAFVATDLFWVPVQEFEALQAGTVVRDRGKKDVRGGHVDWSEGRQRFLDEHGREIAQSEYYRLRPGRIFDTGVVLRTHRDTALAGGPDGWGLDGIDLRRLRDDPDVEVVPFGAREAPRGVVLPVQRTRAEAEDAVRGMAEAFGAAEMDFLGADLRHVFVPVWVVRYRVDRHPYTFVVDGVSGAVLSGRAPEAPRRGVLFVVCAAAYLGFPIGKLVAVAVSGGGRSVAGAAGAAVHLAAEFGFLSLVVPVLLLLPLAFAWGEFRFRGEVVFRKDGPRVEKLARPARTFLEKAIDWLLAQIDRAVENAAQRRTEDGSW
jgi:hypothetical protein